ncbi:hypothetical protein MJO28_009186 [Puccinia striiformis f. sp. tritici]|uniref:Uncharacterized protein n=1 Tax=Puccinia striiformis f. sp. tritici TaxID=168172 RepID=A0ACC0E710_9BASI|nr:hypothetical protein MJO28_009186 [Puccinia striiformis f. sp. tritici]
MPFAVKQNSKFVGCRRIIKRLEVSSLKFSSLVHDKLIRILTQLLNKNGGCKRYPALKERSYSVVVAFYKKAMIPTNRLVSDLVAAEATNINTGHPDFIGGHKAMPPKAAKAAPSTGPLTLDNLVNYHLVLAIMGEILLWICNRIMGSLALFGRAVHKVLVERDKEPR